MNRDELCTRAEVIREKGTDRSQFFRGEIDKYSWRDLGSSFLPGELIAAFLWAQFEPAQEITDRRLAHWSYYHAALESLEQKGLIRRPIIPEECKHNAHMYYVIVNSSDTRLKVLQALKEKGIYAVFHYVPLHSAPAADKFCRSSSELPLTDSLSSRIIRLPLWVEMTKKQQNRVVKELTTSVTLYS